MKSDYILANLKNNAIHDILLKRATLSLDISLKLYWLLKVEDNYLDSDGKKKEFYGNFLKELTNEIVIIVF